MSGTLVTTTSPPLMAPSSIPSSSTPMTITTAVPSPGLSFMRVAATQLVSAIWALTDRSMPPEMTTTAWATAARASGSTPVAVLARLWRS